MNHGPPTLDRQQKKENTCRSHLTTEVPGKEQGTNKLPPTRTLERSEGDGRLQFRGHKMMDMNLEERQISKQIHSLNNID